VDLAHELLLFESQFLALKLDHLQFFAVLAGQLGELDFPLSESIGLQLVLLVDGHQLFQFSLLPSHVRHHAPRLAHQLNVVLLRLVQSELLVFLPFDDLA